MKTNVVERKYDYCRIKYQAQDMMGNDQNHANPHRLIWGQFIAVAEGATNRPVVARSERFSLSNTIGEQPYPDFQNIDHSNLLDDFIEALEEKGWELSRPYNSDLWWEKRLRRPKSMAASAYTIQQRLVHAFAHYY